MPRSSLPAAGATTDSVHGILLRAIEGDELCACGPRAWIRNHRDHFDSGERARNAMLRQMATDKRLPPAELDAGPGVYEDGFRTTAPQWYRNGMKDTDMKMGERHR
ncbi:hypothetical protein AB0L80_21420 [Streptomyces sp. NPDC052069]|uniref:hypothetical protein n=1 Tax=Streptomyces sp. NPDC052069 TaxID=3154650 RepID=UPI00341BD34B